MVWHTLQIHKHYKEHVWQDSKSGKHPLIFSRSSDSEDEEDSDSESELDSNSDSSNSDLNDEDKKSKRKKVVATPPLRRMTLAPNPTSLKVKFAKFKGESKKKDLDAYVTQFSTRWEASGLEGLYGDDVKKQ